MAKLSQLETLVKRKSMLYPKQLWYHLNMETLYNSLLKTGATTYIPLDLSSNLTTGTIIDITKVKLLTLEKMENVTFIGCYLYS